MSAFNIVRFRVRPGREDAFLEAHRRADLGQFKGARRGGLGVTDPVSGEVVLELAPR